MTDFITLVPITSDDKEQFILDNQRAFKYGSQEEFFAGQSGKAERGMRDDRMEEGEEVISSEGLIERLSTCTVHFISYL